MISANCHVCSISSHMLGSGSCVKKFVFTTRLSCQLCLYCQCQDLWWPLCRFVLGRQLIAAAVIGVTTLDQLRILVQAEQKGPLSDEILSEIEKIHRQYPSPAPWRIVTPECMILLSGGDLKQWLWEEPLHTLTVSRSLCCPPSVQGPACSRSECYSLQRVTLVNNYFQNLS